MDSRTARLSALALVIGTAGIVAVSTAPVATADTPERVQRCMGHAVTLVGRQNRLLEGTSHRDVILTNGAGTVRAGGGADLICVNKRSNQRVSAGSGDDRVEVTGDGRFPGRYELGQGEDRFRGGSLRDQVWAESEEDVSSPGEAPDQRDVVVSGDGRDEVHTGSVHQMLRDVVRTGSGRDSIEAANPWQRQGAVLDGGGAMDRLVLYKAADDDAGGSWTLDNRREVLLEGNQAVTRWRSMEDFSLNFPRESADFLGGPRDERFYVNAGEGVDAGAGDDEVQYYDQSGDGVSPLRGGPGHDRLVFRQTGAVLTADLTTDLITSDEGLSQPIPGFEDLWVNTNQADIVGDDGPNDLKLAYSCSGTVRAGAGNDTVRTQTTMDDEEICSGPAVNTYEQYGEAGDDLLVGAFAADDLLDGGPGHDRANGKAGDDVCVHVEVARNCAHG